MDKHVNKSIRIVIIIIMMLCGGVAYAGGEKEAKKILILESSREKYLGSAEIIRGLKQVFIMDERIQVAVFNEEIGGVGEEDIDNSLERSFQQYLELKYKKKKFDLVITLDRAALAFMENYGKEVLGDIPILSVIKCSNEALKLSEEDIGMFQIDNIEQNIKLIKHNHSTIKEVYIIYKQSMENKEFWSTIERYNKQYNLKIVPILLQDLENYHFKGSQDSAMFLLALNQKSNGKDLSDSQYIKYIKSLYKGPIYVQDKNYLDEGVVGGVVFAPYEDGIRLAAQVSKMINNNMLEDRKFKQQERMIIDFSVAKKHDIDLLNLPQSIELVNRMDKYYRLDKQIVDYLIVGGIILLLIIVCILSISLMRMRRMEKRLSASKDEYKTLLEKMPVGVIVLEDKQIKFINKEGLAVLGAKRHQVVGYMEFLGMLVDKMDFEEMPNDFYLIKNKIKTLDNEIKEVEICWFNTSKEEKQKAVTILLDDISYKQLLYESEEKDRIKTQVFTDLSHELKTPINILLSSIQLLDTCKEEEVSKRIVNKSIKVMRQNAYRLLRLVNNIIDTTRLETGYMKLNKQNCNIIELIEEVTLSTIEYAKGQQIEVVFDTEEEEVYMAVDIEKFERIMLNLLSNAIKYNRKGGQILVAVRLKEEALSIMIEDTGIGIPKERLPYIYNRFMRINKEQNTQVEGSGLGLSLVKSLIEQHGGTIQANSTLGVGTIFTIEIPIEIVEGDCIGFQKFSQNNIFATTVELSDLYVE